MSQPLKIVGGALATVIIVAGAILLYAARNLNSIIKERQGYLLAKVSDALDRKIEVSEIKVTLGWGMMADLTGLKIEDDPAISDRPFVEAADAYAKVDLLPLLSRRIHVTEVRLKNPEVHIIRTEQGGYNISTLGRKRPENVETPQSLNAPPITTQHGTASSMPNTMPRPADSGSSTGSVSGSAFGAWSRSSSTCCVSGGTSGAEHAKPCICGSRRVLVILKWRLAVTES